MRTEMAEESGIVLPEAFKEKMRALLGDEYEAFVKSYEKDRVQGLRINTLKTEPEAGLERLSKAFGLQKIPWAREGYYYDGKTRPGKHPFHEAGLYYIQEPSAMAVVELLDPQPGDRVLDLCAAPGGKSTHIAGRLQGQGFLLSNEIHPARAKILSQNIERMGIGNAVVTNEDSGRLAGRFPEFFDKIVVDAPCSGEGMFRKDEGAREEWSPDNVTLCARRQQEILDNAAGMLKGGGRLVYSTCTFSPEENEGSMETFLRNHPEFQIERLCAYDGFGKGRPEWLEDGRPELAATYRIWPHKVEGEGHYLAVLKKVGPVTERRWKKPAYIRDKAVGKALQEFMDETLATGMGEGLNGKRKEFSEDPFRAWKDHLVLFGDQLYTLPEAMTDDNGLKIVRPGLHLGTMKKNRFEPSHALALYLSAGEVAQWYNMASDSLEIVRYLNGEALPVPERSAPEAPVNVGENQASGKWIKETGTPWGSGGIQAGAVAPSWNLTGKGWVLMMVDGYSIGWAKLAGQALKNHYPKGLRRPPF